MANTLATISIVSYVLAVIFLAGAVFCFVKFNIPLVIGDLTGRNAKKSIERMREENEKSGKKSHIPSPANEKRGKITEPIITSGGLASGTLKLKQDQDSPETNLTSENKADASLDSEEQTTLLNENQGTTVLAENTGEEETSPLENERPSVSLKMIDEIEKIHTNEKI